MGRFLRVLVALTVVFHVPFALAAYEALRRAGITHAASGALGLATMGLAMFVGRARAGMPDRPRPELALRLVDIPYFIHWCACIFCLVPTLVGAPLLLLADLATGTPVSLHGGFYLWTYVLGVAVCGYGILVRRKWFVVQEEEVSVPGLGQAFDGYRVAHLSDLHIGALTPKAWGQKWVTAANGRAPDLTVVTGDLVTSGVAFHHDIAEVIGGLTARDGVFVSMGNHDYFGEGEPLISLLRGRGASVLRNEGTALRRGADTLYLAAIDDTWTRRADLDGALAQRPAGAPTMLLAHDPEQFPEAAARGVALTLSGHTHGGQIAVPFFPKRLTISRFAHRFHLGIYRLGDALLYVHPGLGTTGPPIRLGVAPAVVILTLRAASPS